MGHRVRWDGHAPGPITGPGRFPTMLKREFAGGGLAGLLRWGVQDRHNDRDRDIAPHVTKHEADTIVFCPEGDAGTEPAKQKKRVDTFGFQT